MTEELIEQLNEGTVLRPKRWSGDTHHDLGGSVDEEATDLLMEKAAHQLRADAEVIKAAEVLAEALSAYNRGGAGPLTGWIDVEQALDAFHRAMQGRKGGE